MSRFAIAGYVEKGWWVEVWETFEGELERRERVSATFVDHRDAERFRDDLGAALQSLSRPTRPRFSEPA